ncbi:hypothetical protein BCR34DRAFT_293860 [Clohesyomyces aquaticus]|uniref:Uncharacterized protein n=1 Tax=Clohesyomyces aquaticus TaxID=1231657 RepID=A0A1Y2A8C0_9PLEO|nr:hypothetical protein BCR34DRAFT_293860 [Clohesyomyces aquaticus]
MFLESHQNLLGTWCFRMIVCGIRGRADFINLTTAVFLHVFLKVLMPEASPHFVSLLSRSIPVNDRNSRSKSHEMQLQVMQCLRSRIKAVRVLLIAATDGGGCRDTDDCNSSYRDGSDTGRSSRLVSQTIFTSPGYTRIMTAACGREYSRWIAWSVLFYAGKSGRLTEIQTVSLPAATTARIADATIPLHALFSSLRCLTIPSSPVVFYFF